MSVTIRNRTPGIDPIARVHRRRAVAKASIAALLVVVIICGFGWLLFASSVFSVTDIQIDGTSASVSGELRTAVEGLLGKTTLGFLHPGRNILFLDEEGVAATLHAQFENIESLSASKSFPHTLHIQAHERTAMGTWCRSSGCRYFDITGARWGSAVPSRGPLLLLVMDEQTDAVWDERLFDNLKSIIAALPAIGMHPIVATLQDGAPGDLRITLSEKYDLLFDALGDITDQLTTLKVFVSDKAADPTWKPQYIDLRSPGRVYYK